MTHVFGFLYSIFPKLFGIPVPIVELYEESVIEMLSEYIPEQNDEEIKIKQKRERNKKIKRYVMIGLASVGGGAIIGYSFHQFLSHN